MNNFLVTRFSLFLLHLLVFVLVSLFFCPVSSLPQNDGLNRDRLKFILGENLGPWRNGMSQAAAEAPGPSDDNKLLLAAKRTNRPDILRGFKRYRDGWNITNRHYWASVGFTGAAGFILAVLWFFSFGLALSIRYCCRWRVTIKGKGSERSQKICLMLLIVFTCAAGVGCILLSVGQDEFHDEALHTLKYVVNQSDYTVQTLRNVTKYLSLAKTTNVAQVFLPSNVLDAIDKLNVDLNSAADILKEKTSENAGKIKNVFNAAISVDQCGSSDADPGSAWFLFVVSGWLLVAITFVLCGVFIILNNAISDTCVAMEEWVEHPHAVTALSSILPCVDQSTTNKTLIQSKEVINDIVNVVNTYVYTFANANPSPSETYNYYNQSGPLMPPLCYPFDSNLQDRQCASQEVSLTNASEVWRSYICNVSPLGLCTTVGRVTPEVYEQLVAAVMESYALEHYTPVLLSLQDCKFVRDTFQEITSNYCPPLEHYLRIVNVGLGLVSVGILLCLILWILYANRPQREEVFVKLPLPIKGSIMCNKSKTSSRHNSDIDAWLSNTNEV